MNKLVYISLLSILILYVHCGDTQEGGTGAGAGTGTETGTGAGTGTGTTTACDNHVLSGTEKCDNLKVSDSTKKKCVEKTDNNKKICKEVDKESAGEMLSIFKISFALLILFTIL